MSVGGETVGDMTDEGGQLLLKLLQGNDSIFDVYGDRRVQNWFLLDSPAPVLVILAVYLLFCVKLGPLWMKNRKPFQLQTPMIVYNAVNVVGSTWLVFEALQGGWWGDYNFTCQSVDYSYSPKALQMTRVCWVYFLFKIFELLDTVFFVLRKKDSQVTFLHLYHHSIMPLITWSTAKFWPGGHGSLAGLINAGVHIVMYSYYLLSAMGPRYMRYLWWKKYLTSIQLVQFLIIIVHQSQVFFNGCNLPKFIPTFFTLNSGFFLYLFGSFYVRTYFKQAKKTRDNGCKTELRASHCQETGSHTEEMLRTLGSKCLHVKNKTSDMIIPRVKLEQTAKRR